MWRENEAGRHGSTEPGDCGEFSPQRRRARGQSREGAARPRPGNARPDTLRASEPDRFASRLTAKKPRCNAGVWGTRFGGMERAEEERRGPETGISSRTTPSRFEDGAPAGRAGRRAAPTTDLHADGN